MLEGLLESELEAPWAEPNWAALDKRAKLTGFKILFSSFFFFLIYLESRGNTGVVVILLLFNI